MKTKKHFLLALFSLAVLVGFSSCSDDDNKGNETVYPVLSNGVLILNNGDGGANGAVLSYYDNTSNSMVEDLFKKVNNKELGSLGQCVIEYENRIYVSVEKSNRVFVLDNTGKIVKTITHPTENGSKFSPKMMTAHNGKVYVASYAGDYIARIDTATWTIDKTKEVGKNPEDMRVVNNKLYVANSGGLNYENGYDKTLSVLDLELATEHKISVTVNPNILTVDSDNNLYVLSFGVYDNAAGGYVGGALQQIDTNRDESKVLKNITATDMSISGNKIYLLSKDYLPPAYEPKSSFSYYDITTKEIVEEGFIKDNTVIKDISAFKFNASTGKIYVTAGNSQNTGDLYVFSSEGKFLSKSDTGGAYPSKTGICFVGN